MKKLILFMFLFVTLSNGFSQVKRNAGDMPVRTIHQESLPALPSLKGGGDIIWQTSFDWSDPSNQQGWSLPAGWNIVDNSDLGNSWIWRDDTLGGLFTTVDAPNHFATPKDGFICVPMDEYNSRDDVSTNNVIDTHITTPPIDCSNSPSVMVRFNQEFRLCCRDYNIEMLVTNDGGVHWASYEIRFGVRGNTVTPEKFHSPEINISDVAAGMKNVQVRFYIHGMTQYYIMIDDLKLVEAFENDLVLTDTWSDFNGGFTSPIGHINFVPFSQIGMDSKESGRIGEYSFKGSFLNNGMSDQENVFLNLTVQRNGSEVMNQNSSKRTIWPLERDTNGISQSYFPADYGDYLITYSAQSDNPEEVPSNNTSTTTFTVNDSLYQRADFTAEAGISSGAWAGGGSPGDVMAISYDVQTACEISSISAYLWAKTEDGNPSFQFVLYKYVAEADDYIEVIATDIVEMDSSMRRKIITLPVSKDGESEFLQPGEYLVGVKSWGTDGTEGLDVGWDLTTKFPTGYSLSWQVADNEWATIDKLTMIGFNIKQDGGPTTAPVTFNVDMTNQINSGEFKPGTDFVDISGSFNNWGTSERMTDPEGDGIYTLLIPEVPIGKEIEFKYRINGNWETSELTDGAPNRKYTVRYWNNLNHVYNNGISAGIKDLFQSNRFIVFPNPSNGNFNVKIENLKGSDLCLQILNLEGQICFEKTYFNQLFFDEFIQTNLSTGVYFLKVKSGDHLMFEKLVIR
jgi:hypothetical protein